SPSERWAARGDWPRASAAHGRLAAAPAATPLRLLWIAPYSAPRDRPSSPNTGPLALRRAPP
ncbi:MAG: hypothetical protein ACYCUE_13380, partial [Steroidobacteraceae bacterium]